MAGEPEQKARIHERLGRELRRYAIISAYLYVCFGAITFYKAAVLHGHGISYAPFGFAIVKALIAGKFVLIGHEARIGDRYEGSTRSHRIAYKSLMFVLLLFVLTVIEEIVAGLIHHRGLVDSVSEIGGGTLWEAVATSVLMLLIFIPYFAYLEIDQALGERGLLRLFLERRGRAEPAESVGWSEP